MSSKITAATLTVTVTEDLVLNGVQQGNSMASTVASVNECSRRIVTVLHSAEATLLTIAAAIDAGTFITSTTKYIRITNTDTENHVTLRITNSNNDECIMKLDAKQTFIFHGDSANGMTAVFDATDGGTTGSTLGTLSSIKAQADTASVDLEVLVAGT